MINVQFKRRLTKFMLPGDPFGQSLEIAIDFDSFQHLTCLCNPYKMSKWCEHVAAVYTRGVADEGDRDIDGRHIASTTAVQLYKPPLPLSVPLLILQPTWIKKVRPAADGEPDIKTDLEMASERLMEVKIVFGNVKINPKTSSADADGTASIGFIRRDIDGRRTLRRLVFEWLWAIPSLYPDKMKCKHNMHGIGSCFFENNKPSQLEDNEMRAWFMRDAWSLIDRGMCYNCDLVLSANDEDDMLPF